VTFDERPVEQEQTQTEEMPIPEEGDYDEWFEYFAPFFGFDNEG